jgi:hypothetical protein
MPWPRSDSGKKEKELTSYQSELKDAGLYVIKDGHLEAHQNLIEQAEGILQDDSERKKNLPPRRLQLLNKVDKIETITARVLVWTKGAGNKSMIEACEAYEDELNQARRIIFSKASDVTVENQVMDILSWSYVMFTHANTEDHVTPSKGWTVQTSSPQHSAVRIDSTSEEESTK